MRAGAVAGATLMAGASLAGASLGVASSAGAAEVDGTLSPGDAAILRFLAAAEILETDLWIQYAELGGAADAMLPGVPTAGSPAYMAALSKLDGDMTQYVVDNTTDEVSHQAFLNAYLMSKGADPVDLDPFRTLPSSTATGARQIGRLTNLMQLTLDTSWYTRYRDDQHNPDLSPDFVFPQAVPSLAAGQFPAIPRSDADLTPGKHLQAIANTAAFHFATIEQGGTSLYPTLAQKVRSPEVLRILLSIGPTEAAHFSVWQDTAGNAVAAPLAPLTDPTNPALTFPDVNAPPFGGPLFQTNRIMPNPTPFLDAGLPACSIVRPSSTQEGGAVAALRALTASGLFLGQSHGFFDFLKDLAHAADRATRA
jgi:hypothetical protein